MRIAVLGGSFDPIHIGHLQIAKAALKQAGIDEVWFMVANDTPLKQGQLASFQARCAMVKIAIAPYRHMKLCTLEGEIPGQSYTIQTVKMLQKRYTMYEFAWLIGDDQALHFHEWKEHEQLMQLLPFYVCSRFDEDVTIPQGFKRIQMPLVDVSSTAIRSGSQFHMLPRGVRAYMGKHGLYLSSIIQSHMSEKRYLHSLSVALLCQDLAQAHGLDEKLAYRMGLVHDLCKQMPLAKAKIWMKYHMPEHMDEPCAIWHGYIGAYEVSHHLAIDNKQIIHAIYHHVKGNNHGDYNRILYIADKLDPSRGYDSSKEIAISKKSLKEGFIIVQEQQIQYLYKEGTLLPDDKES